MAEPLMFGVQVVGGEQFQAQVVAAQRSDGKSDVVLLMSIPGAVFAVPMAPALAEGIAAKLAEAAATARSGLTIAKPGDVPPANPRRN